MGIEIHEWPDGAFEHATLLARGLLEASRGDVTAVRKPLQTMIAAMALPGASDDDVVGLTNQVLAQPDIAALITGHTQAHPTAPSRPHGGRLIAATGSRDETVRIWDPLAGTQIDAPLTGHTDVVLSVALGTAPDGRLIAATGSWDNTVRIWDPLAGTPIGAPLTGHTDGVWSVALGIAPDGCLIAASGSRDKTVRIWDALAGTPIGPPLTGHTNSVRSVSLSTSADGRLIAASGSWDDTVRIWDALVGTPVGPPLTGHTQTVMSVALGIAPQSQ